MASAARSAAPEQDAAMQINPVTPAVPSPTLHGAPAKRRRRWWARAVLPVLLLLLATVWFAPVVVARTGLLNRFAREALADLRGTVTVGGASLGWFSPVELRDVTVKDEQGRTLLAAPKVTGSKTLLALLRNKSDPGEFTVEGVTAEIVCEKGTSNLEDALAHYLKDDTPPGPTRTPVVVRVAGGRITLRDADAQKAWDFTAVDATVTVPRERSSPVQVKLAAATPGKLDADLSLGDGGTAKLTAVGFPLDALAPALRRVEPGLTVGGQLTADLTARWGKDSAVNVDGTAAVRDLDLAGPRLNGDRFRLASVELPLKIESTGGTVRVERAELKCDVGTLTAAGTFAPDASFDKLLDNPGVRLEADVDLAKVAALLPKLLRIREGTAIREGRLTAKLVSRGTPAGTTWDGEVHTAALKAVRDGKDVAWEQPLSVEFSGRVPPGQLPVFDKFVCRSDFIAVNAQGSPESFRAAANVYLGRLTTRLSEFVDLGGHRLDGEASVWVSAVRKPDGAFRADGGVKLQNLVFADRDGHGLKEPALEVKASAAGKAPADGPVRVESGTLAVAAGADTLDVALLEPVPDARQFAAGRLSLKLAGDLGRWRARAAGFVRIPKHYVFGGATTASGTVRLEPGKLAVDRLTLAVQNARFRGAGLDLSEPTLSGTADLSVNRTTGAAAFANFAVTSPVLTVAAGSLTFDPQPNGGLVVAGSGNAVSDLNRLGRTLGLQSDPKGGDALHGRATGPVRFRWSGDTTAFGGTLDVKDFAFGDPKQTGIAEPALKLVAEGQYDDAPDTLRLARARVERPGLAVEAKGTIAKVITTQDVVLDGTTAYSFAELGPELRKALGDGFQITGRGEKPFALRGSLAPKGTRPGPPPSVFAALSATAGVGWSTVRAYGFDMGPGDLNARLAGGVLTVTPIAATFTGGGKVSLTPTVRLDPAPAELTFAKGKVVDRAKLTPAVCAGVAGYALPVIAKSAQAEGELSVTLDDSRVPLEFPEKATAKGHILIHRATVGPGPVVGEIAKLLGATGTTITLANETTVPVRVEGGRVFHENLALTVNGYVVRTTGSVGFDGTLALVADVPVPASAMKNNPVLAKALAGKVVKVPVAGTLAKPAVDAKQFQAAVLNLARDAARDTGKDLLNKELEKLFPGMPALPKKK